MKSIAITLSLASTSFFPACQSAESAGAAPVSAAAIELKWEPWSDAAFARAKSEQRLVLLDLQAVWCHWCHVMEETTYRDPRVQKLLSEHFVLLKVDQDSRPDLSNRYEDYGWPATILFRGDGAELAKRAGYLAPDEMVSLLEALIADPTPGPSVSAAPKPVAAKSAVLEHGLRSELEQQLVLRYDDEHGGPRGTHKFLDAPSLELLIEKALGGDDKARARARQTLDASLALIDPVWGGVYQYSVGGDWKEPHFEKIMSFQSDDLRVYSLAYAAFHDERYLKAARDIERYLATFLSSPGGAFYTSQDADLIQGEHSGEYFALSDAARRAQGIPRIDEHVYARENGWAIRGLLALYGVTHDERLLTRSLQAAEWIVAQRTLPKGGYRHDERDAAGPYLGDTLAMGQAFLALYEASGERKWLARASEASRFAADNFITESEPAGYSSSSVHTTGQGPLGPQPPQRDENIALARWESALFHYDGDRAHKTRAERALRWLAAPEVARKGFPAGILLADREAANDPLHLTLVGAKSDARAKTLWGAALALPLVARRIEWWDPKEGPLPHADTELPELDEPAIFSCGNGRCSAPAFDAEDLQKRVAKLKP